MRPSRTVKEPGPNVRTRGTRRRGGTDAVIVRCDDSISRKPSRRAPAAHPPVSPTPAPAVPTAAIAQQAGRPCQRAIRHADRHRDHPLMPTPIVNMGKLTRNTGPRRLVTATRRIPATATTSGRRRRPERRRPHGTDSSSYQVAASDDGPRHFQLGAYNPPFPKTEYARMADMGAARDACT